MQRTPNRALPAAALAILVLVAACGGGAPTPTPAAPTAAPPTQAASAPAATDPSTGEPSLDAPATVQAGTTFEISWTGPNATGDYIVIIEATAAKWTTEPYVNADTGSPATLPAPSKAGAYELRYVSIANETVLVRRPITVTAFVGDLAAPDSVEANTEFAVAWNGPNGPGDYVTIIKVGKTAWSNEDYFDTTEGSPANLLAPIEPGAYEIWYVIGSDKTIQSRRPITVTATTATLQAAAEVGVGAQFQVKWTGPNGPGDYVTIVPPGSAPAFYLAYFNTSAGSPGTLTAPDAAGDYEIWYVTGQGPTVIATIPIKVK